MLCSILGIRPALKSKIDDAYKIAYLKCALNMNAIPKMKHFRSIAGEKMKAKIGIYECYFGKLII